jgi:hypothetical protein
MSASPADHAAKGGRVDPACPPETYWDGLACAHARATCGAWDGLTCEPSDTRSPRQEWVQRKEFERLDDEAQAACHEDDESSQVYSGAVSDVVRAIDEALGRAEQIGERLGQLRDASQTPRWEVATYARLGSLYECIWNRARGATPSLFTPQQQAVIAKLGTMAQLQNNAGQAVPAPPIMQGQVAAVRQLVADKWRFTRGRYLAVLEMKMVRSYATAILLARRYDVEGYELTRASERLAIVASTLGDEAMSRLLADMVDPTDPEPDATKRRHLTYAAGAFAVAR